MPIDVIYQDERMVIRRQTLGAGAATPWHTDPCRRFTVVVRGARLAIEYLDSGERVEFEALTGEAAWDEPNDRVHRAVNLSDTAFEEVVTYYIPAPGADPQPIWQETA